MTRALAALALGSMLACCATLPAAAQDVPLCVEIDDALSPIGVSDGAGGAIFVWSDERDSTAHPVRLFAQHVDGGGVVTWTAGGVQVAIAPGDQVAAAMLADGAGGAFVAWSDNRLLPAPAQIYAQRLGPGGVAMWGPAGVAVATTPSRGRQSRIALVSDGAGGVFVAWEADGGPSGADIYAQRLSPGGAPMWAAAGASVCTAPGSQALPVAVGSSGGSFIVVWQDWRGGIFAPSNPYAQRIDATGAALWAPCGLAVTTSPAEENGIVAAPDPGGGVVVAWDDDRNGSTDIYAQRLDAAGAPLWDGPEPGPDLLVSSAPSDQLAPRIVRQLPGVTVVAWQDFRAANWNVYAQAITNAGTLLWDPNGRAITVAPENQWLRGLAADPSGALFFAWHDERGPLDVSDIYAQYLDPSGAPVWPANGLQLVTAPNAQRNPVAVAIGGMEALVAWEDARSNVDWDIYYRAVPLSPLSVPEIRGDAVRKMRVSPNPAVSGAVVRLTLARAQQISVGVFDLRGRAMAGIFEGHLPAGDTDLAWNGRGKDGEALPAGIYFVRVREASGAVQSRRLAVTK